MGFSCLHWHIFSNVLKKDFEGCRQSLHVPATIFLPGIFLFLVLAFSAFGQTSTHTSANAPEKWIFEETSRAIEGLGVADYSRFNPEKSWEEALENAVNDLNANHSLIVSYYGAQIGRGPLRIRSDYAIRTFLDTTQVTVLDSTVWKGRAFLRIKPRKTLPDSIIYPNANFRSIGRDEADTAAFSGQRWLVSTGATSRIESNWYMSLTKAKQDALRKLAEDLSIKVSTETYSKGERYRRYYRFSTLFAFQRIRVLKRIFDPDSVKVQVAVDPREVKMLMD